MTPGSKHANGGLEITIDELVLEGFAPADRDALAQALERKLSALLDRPGAIAAGSPGWVLERMDAGQIQLGPRATPAAAGEMVAGVVAKGLQTGNDHA